VSLPPNTSVLFIGSVPGCRDEHNGVVEPKFLNVKIKANPNSEHAGTNVNVTGELDRFVLDRDLRGKRDG